MWPFAIAAYGCFGFAFIYILQHLHKITWKDREPIIWFIILAIWPIGVTYMAYGIIRVLLFPPSDDFDDYAGA